MKKIFALPQKSATGWIELMFFWAVLIYNLSIVFATKYFPTFDGGAHAYNANIIYQLLTDSNSIYKDYFEFNSELVPNWTSYIILFIFRSFFSYAMAEKMLLVLFFMLTPFLFRLVIKRFKDHNIWLSYLIFPFTHFYLLYMGFFNFTLGITFFFWFIYVYLGLKDKISVKKMFYLFLILTAVFFSHIFVFVATVVFMATHSGMLLVSNFKEIRDQKFRWVLNRAVNLLVPSIPFLILTAAYFIKRPSIGMETFLKTEELNTFLLDIAPMHAFGAAETPFCRGMFYVIYAIVVLTIGQRIFLFKKEEGLSSFFKINDVFLLLTALFIYFTYTQPNEDGYGGFISIRMVLFVYLFLLIWLASCNIGTKFTMLILPFYFYFAYQEMNIKKESMVFLNNQVKKLDVCAEKLEPNKTLIPFFFADYYLWQGIHYCNYLAGEKPIVILNNYEAHVNYFPIVWNKDRLNDVVIGNLHGNTTCQSWSNKIGAKQQKADYVFVFGEKPGDACYESIIKVVWENYVAIAKDHDVTLYKLKP